MRWARELRLAAMAALAAAGGLSSLAALVALNAGGGMSLGRMDLLPIAAGYDRRANRDLAATGAASTPAWRDAAALSRAALAQYPYDMSAWLRLAYLNQAGDSQLTPDGVSALARSYDLVAVDPAFGLWRVNFALEHSQALSPALRAMVRQEVRAIWTNPDSRGELHNLQSQLHNPAGRLSLTLWINHLQAASAK